MQNKGKKSGKKKAIRQDLPEKTYTWINLTGSLLFALYSFWFLAVHKADLMFRLQELSLFLFDRTFFVEHLNSPGRLLEYAGKFLTQFFYFPWLGALVLTLLLVLWQWMLIRAFNLPKQLRLLSLLPPAMALLYIGMQEYSIFVAKYAVLSQVTGMLLSVLPLFVAAYLPKTGAKILFLLAFGVLTYPFIGFYALLGALLLWVRLFTEGKTVFQEIVPEGAQPQIKSIKYSKLLLRQLLLLIYIIGIPPLFFLLSGQNINPKYLFAYGLPVYDYPNTPVMWTALVACILLLFGLGLLPFAQTAKGRRNWWLNPLFLVLAITFVQAGSYKDLNFETQLAMERAISDNDWDKVLELARKPNKNPNRLMVIYRNIALYNKNQLCEKMFMFPNSDEPFHTKNTLVSNTIIGAPVNCFYYGLLNYSYRWNMENMVLFGPRVENLRFMMMSALLNGEMELAGKYIHILEKTLFYKKWAEEHRVYLQNPALLLENKQYKTLLALTKYENVLGQDQRVIELTILNHFAQLKSGTDEMLEWSMSSVLTTKSVYRFWPMFFVYVNKNLPLPRHVQEAALLLAYFEKKELGDLLKRMDSQVLQRFDEFKRITESNTHLTEEQLATLLKRSFEKSYWYYFCFVKDLKTN
ncbi:MAG: DUF6057 family protein [Bacteroidales bacterium]|nr:DUF6057 family protein [Bacteroidales bacterium]MDD3431845.1 DUF6057 family protein [Bacteroidales bacterium]MDD4361273.1 DUF6057 family protein [Bacteroidales bacterium]